MAKNRRKSARKTKATSSMLMLLVIAAAVLAFVPFRVTLAAGSLGNTSLDKLLPAGTIPGGGNLTGILAELGGTHITADSVTILASSTTVLSALTNALKVDYAGLKIQRLSLDISNSKQTDANFRLPFGPSAPGTSFTPAPYSPGNIIQVRVVALSVSVTGYKAPTVSTNRYGETDLIGLNPAIQIGLDRILIDLFIDPYAGITTYLVQADMTVYQGLALLIETSLL